MLDLTKTSEIDYSIITTLGQGAFGITFLATKKDDPTGKKYVLKVLTVSPKTLSDIHQEVDVLRSISSKGCQPGLLCYHDYFVTEMHNTVKLVIVTEAFDNSITLGKFVYTRKLVPLEAQDLLKIMHSLLEGLYYLHKHKLAHGDIKPDNILINDSLQTQIIDFGLSCRKNCKAGGTLLFSAPEMIRLLGSRREIQRSFLSETDVFSMGLVFYLLANYKFPYSIQNNSYVYEPESSVSEQSITQDSDGSDPDRLSYSSDSDAGSVISSRRSSEPKQVYDVKFPNDILGLDSFWRGDKGKVKSYYTNSDVATNADINDLIESMLIVGTHAKNARPSAKRLLSKLRRIIYKYNFRQANINPRKKLVLPSSAELEALTPLTPSPKIL